MGTLARHVNQLVKGVRFLIRSTGVSYVASPQKTTLEQGVRSMSNLGGIPELIALLQQVLVFDPLLRPDMSDLLNHPWFIGSSDLASSSGPASE